MFKKISNWVILLTLLLSACSSTAGAMMAEPERIPPVEGAINPFVLAPRQTNATDPSFHTDAYTVYNDGYVSGLIMITGVWDSNSRVTKGLAVLKGSYIIFDGYLFENNNGTLVIWSPSPSEGGD